MQNSLKESDYLYKNHDEDLMEVFQDDSIKGINANVGGMGWIRM